MCPEFNISNAALVASLEICETSIVSNNSGHTGRQFSLDTTTSITDLSAYISLAVALACGILIGLDRERNDDDEFGGIRTYPLIALVGAIAQYLAVPVGRWIIGLTFLGVIGWVAIYYFTRTTKGHYGMTSEFASLVTFLCGVLAMQGHLGLAFAIAITVTTILALKGMLHRGVQNLSPEDVNSIRSPSLPTNSALATALFRKQTHVTFVPSTAETRTVSSICFGSIPV